MTTLDIIEPWLAELADELRGIHTEGVHESRWKLLETYHAIGRTLVENPHFRKNAHGNGKTLSRVSNLAGIHERDLYRAMVFYDKYPDMDRIPGGKSASWHKIVAELLPENPPEPAPPCPTCGRPWKQKG